MLDQLKSLNLFWIVDPTTKKDSVSLTLLMLSFLAVIIANGLEIAEVTKTSASVNEMFLTTAGLYFGRRLSFKGTQYGTDATTTEKAQ